MERCEVDVSSVPAETRGQSGSMGSSGVSTGSGLDTQLRQRCRRKEKKTNTSMNPPCDYLVCLLMEINNNKKRILKHFKKLFHFSFKEYLLSHQV